MIITIELVEVRYPRPLTVGDRIGVSVLAGTEAHRLAGWFEDARAILIGRTHPTLRIPQRDAVQSVLGDLRIPIVLDVDCGHVIPQLALINGAVARVTVDESGGRITQQLG